MLFILLGTFVAGIGAAGLAIALYRFILHKPRPKWVVPVSAGTAMILLQVVLDYGWYSRATADFGDDIVVLRTAEGTSPLQPLSYIIPRTDRFLALDKRTIKTHDALPGIKLVSLFQASKDGPTLTVLNLIDCTTARRSDWANGDPITPDAVSDKATWHPLEPDSQLLQASCE